MTLEELQTQLLSAMYQSSAKAFDRSLINSLDANHGLSPEQQLAVYHGSVQGGLIEALGDIYPRVKQSLGTNFFTALAQLYLQAYPSLSPRLDDFGVHLSEFCEDFKGLEMLPYCSDLVRLDWAWHRAFHAKNVEELKPEALHGLTETELSECLLRLTPSVFILQSAYPIYQIWSLCNLEFRGEDTDKQVDLAEGAEAVLVWRQGFQTRVSALSPLELSFLQRVKVGQPLGDIFTALLSEGHDLSLCFGRLLALGVFGAKST